MNRLKNMCYCFSEFVFRNNILDIIRVVIWEQETCGTNDWRNESLKGQADICFPPWYNPLWVTGLKASTNLLSGKMSICRAPVCRVLVCQLFLRASASLLTIVFVCVGVNVCVCVRERESVCVLIFFSQCWQSTWFLFFKWFSHHVPILDMWLDKTFKQKKHSEIPN